MLLLRLALRPWRLAPLSQLFSALAVGFLLVLAGLLFWLQKGLTPVLARLQNEQVITAYLDPALDTREEFLIVDRIREAVGAHPESSGLEVQFTGPDLFIKNLKGPYPELARELEDLGSETSSVVPRFVTVSGILPDSALENVKSLQGIESAESSRDHYRSVMAAFSALRWVAKIMVTGLCLALLTGLIHLARMNSYLHRDAVSLLRLWGAGDLLLRAPELLSGMVVGCLGGAVALGSWMTAGTWLSRHIRALSPLLRDMPIHGWQLGLSLFATGALIGLMAGVLGSLGGVSRSNAAGSIGRV